MISAELPGFMRILLTSNSPIRRIITKAFEWGSCTPSKSWSVKTICSTDSLFKGIGAIRAKSSIWNISRRCAALLFGCGWLSHSELRQWSLQELRLSPWFLVLQYSSGDSSTCPRTAWGAHSLPNVQGGFCRPDIAQLSAHAPCGSHSTALILSWRDHLASLGATQSMVYPWSRGGVNRSALWTSCIRPGINQFWVDLLSFWTSWTGLARVGLPFCLWAGPPLQL